MGPAQASEKGYFILPVRPGATVHSTVRVTNIGRQTGTASLYAVDGTTGQTSGAVYRSRQEPRKDVGAWLHLARAAVTLAPGTSADIPFRVKVPPNVSAGQHLGGIVVQPSTLTSSKKVSKAQHSFRVNIRELSVVAVQVNVPGRRLVKMAITGLRPGGIPGRQALLIGLSNLGNVLVKGRGSLTVLSSSGRRLKHQRFPLDTFVSDTHIGYPAYTAGKALPPGSYKGIVAITYRGHRLVRTFPFTISAAQKEQVFGSPAAQDPGSLSNNTLLYVLLGAAVALLAAIAFGFYRYLRGAGYI